MNRNLFLTALATLAMALVFSSPMAQAADALADTCADYNAASDDPAYQTYIAGYTAANGGDAAAIERATETVRTTCQAKPSQGFATTVAQSIAPQEATASVPVAQPTSCSAPATAACSGCSISCAAGTQAMCRAGKDYGGGVRCGSRPSCRCQ